MGTLTLSNATPVTAAGVDGNFIRFRITDSGPSSPGASPSATLTITNAQLQTACPDGELKRIFNVFSAGLPAEGGGANIIAAGAITQAQARALLLSDDSAGTTLSNTGVPRAACRIYSRGANNSKPGGRVWSVDANVDSSGKPVLFVTAVFARSTVVTPVSPFLSPNNAYLDIEFRSTPAGR